jgi:hypothetical protein
MQTLGTHIALQRCDLALTALAENNQARKINVFSFEGSKLLFRKDLWQRFLGRLTSRPYENRMPGTSCHIKAALSHIREEAPNPHPGQILEEAAQVLDPAADNPIPKTQILGQIMM